MQADEQNPQVPVDTPTDREALARAVASAKGVSTRVRDKRIDLSGVDTGGETQEKEYPIQGYIVLKIAAFNFVRRGGIFATEAQAKENAVRLKGPHIVQPVY